MPHPMDDAYALGAHLAALNHGPIKLALAPPAMGGSAVRMAGKGGVSKVPKAGRPPKATTTTAPTTAPVPAVGTVAASEHAMSTINSAITKTPTRVSVASDDHVAEAVKLANGLVGMAGKLVTRVPQMARGVVKSLGGRRGVAVAAGTTGVGMMAEQAGRAAAS